MAEYRETLPKPEMVVGNETDPNSPEAKLAAIAAGLASPSDAEVINHLLNAKIPRRNFYAVRALILLAMAVLVAALPEVQLGPLARFLGAFVLVAMATAIGSTLVWPLQRDIEALRS